MDKNRIYSNGRCVVIGHTSSTAAYCTEEEDVLMVSERIELELDKLQWK